MEMGGGYWVKIEARAVPATQSKPAGVDYSLCLFGPANERLICYDNAHAIRVGSGPAKRQTVTFDHAHKGAAVRPYSYKNAETLLLDFWNDVEATLKKAGIS